MEIAVTAGILAGGKSSRMGQNKALLDWQGQSFLSRTAALFQDVSEVLVSVNDQQIYKDCGYRLIVDKHLAYGPLEGLYQLLNAAEYPWVFLTAVDMPLLSKELINRMLRIDKSGLQAVIIKNTDGLQPLCGIYHRSVIPVIEQLFKENSHSLHGLLKGLRVKSVDIAELGFSDVVLMNVNTPEDYWKLDEAVSR